VLTCLLVQRLQGGENGVALVFGHDEPIGASRSDDGVRIGVGIGLPLRALLVLHDEVHLVLANGYFLPAERMAMQCCISIFVLIVFNE